MNPNMFRRSIAIVSWVACLLGPISLQAQTPGKLSKFLDSSGTLGDSVVTEVNGNIGVSGSPPQARLYIEPSSREGTGRVGLGTGTEVIGVGTQFLTELHPGDSLFTAGQSRIIQVINSDTSLNTVAPFSIPFSDSPFILEMPSFETLLGPLVVNPQGNIGVGTPIPDEKLTILTPTNSYGVVHTDATVVVGSWVGAGSAGSPGGWFGTKSNHPLRFFAGNRPVSMTIDTVGNVGIGRVANPNVRLDVLSDRFSSIWAESSSSAPLSRAVMGLNNAPTGQTFGVWGETSSSSAGTAGIRLVAEPETPGIGA